MKSRSGTRLLRRSLFAILAALGSVTVALATMAYLYQPDFRGAVERERAKSGIAVSDRAGHVLRLIPDAQGRFNLWTPIDRVPDCVKQAVVAAEDKRFLYHFGFDPIATGRAIYTNLTRARTVSGASTITQQVLRLMHPRPRTYRSKIIEILSSAKMEWQLSKDEILELYLNLSPMGGNVRGVGLAARVYFGKDVMHLHTGEAACLAALPRSPSRYDPRRASGRRLVLKEKDRILGRMTNRGLIDGREGKIISGASVEFRISSIPLQAPHFVNLALSRTSRSGHEFRTTLDLGLQRGLEKIVASHRIRLASMGIRQCAALVASAPEAEVLAMVGSQGYSDQAEGFNNGVLAARGAGSTLKPFLYGLALEKGYNAFAEIPDTFMSYPSPHGDYLPVNADRKSYGPVTIRSALGNSLNISAVKTIRALGVVEFYRLLKTLEIVSDQTHPPEYYGLGLAVGNMEVSLYRLVQAYGCFAREGRYKPLSVVKDEYPRPVKIFTPETAYVISHILADPSARLLTFGNPDYLDFGCVVATKTGTSSNYRDSWIIGYTPQHVVGVWAGNFSGDRSGGASGGTACGPILKDIVRLLYRSGPPGGFRRPESVTDRAICWMSGKPASERCPYSTLELSIGDPSPASLCDLPHQEHQFHDLGAPYVNWVSRRQTEQGLGRYRLAQGKVVSPLPLPWGPGATMTTDDRGPMVRTARISIVHPHNFDHVVRSPYQETRVHFRATADPIVPHVIWLVDGVEIGKTPPPYELFWSPQRGRHVIHAVTPSRQAAQVTIHVE